jgi:hypothetical protein
MTNVPTQTLARELVQLDQAIKQASRERRFLDAFDLEQTREHVLYLRMAMLRRRWSERQRDDECQLEGKLDPPRRQPK